MNIQGYCSFIFLFILTGIVILLSIPETYWWTSYFISLFFAAYAFVLMGFCCILATKFHFLERIFDGLDKMYHLHKWMAIIALIFVFFHIFLIKPSIKILRVDPTIYIDKIWIWRIVILALIFLFVTELIALNRNIKYHIWRWAHKLSIIVFSLVVLHWLTEKMPTDFLISPLGLLILSFSVLGLLCALYKLLLYGFIHKSKPYEVVKANFTCHGMCFSLKPLVSPVFYHAGSFIFLSFKRKGLREYHPFTISNYDTEHNLLSFIIKVEGNYTRRLKKELQVGLGANVSVSHGLFLRQTGNYQEFWFAAGVGITPFLAWMDTIKTNDQISVKFYYLFKKSNQIINIEKLREICRIKGVDLKVFLSDEKQSFKDIIFEKNMLEKNVKVFFCGPKRLKSVIKNQFAIQGYNKVKIHSEIYNFR